MKTPKNADTQSVALAIISSSSLAEQMLLCDWLETLLEVRNTDRSRLSKAKAALAATLSSRAIWPMIKVFAAQVKKHGWENRTLAQRWAAVASGLGIAVFGGQSAGIAALGGAVGVPLWVVFGGGAAFAKVMLDDHFQPRQAGGRAPVGSPSSQDAVTIDGVCRDMDKDV